MTTPSPNPDDVTTRLRAFSKSLSKHDWTSALLAGYNPTGGLDVSFEQAKASLAADIDALTAMGGKAEPAASALDSRAIDPWAWAEAVRADFNGKPMWIWLADHPAETELVREMLSAYINAAAPASPVQARTGEVTVPVEALLAIRDALVVRDVNEAYHHLYRIADPTFCEMKPWADLEATLSEPPKA